MSGARRPQDALNQLRTWRDPTPSLRAVWHDLKVGGGHALADGGLVLAAGYWALGVIGFPLVAAAKHVEIVFARPGRIVGFLIFALLFGGALLIAYMNSTP